jgi:hypothetical protein
VNFDTKEDDENVKYKNHRWKMMKIKNKSQIQWWT